MNDDGGGSYGQTMLAEAGCSGESATTCIAKALTPANRQPFAATSSILADPLPGKGIAAIVAAAERGLEVPGLVEGGVSFDAFGGAIAEVAADATAFPGERPWPIVQYTATWPYADAGSDPAPFDDFVQSERTALQPWLGNSAYVNYADRTLDRLRDGLLGPEPGPPQHDQETLRPGRRVLLPAVGAPTVRVRTAESAQTSFRCGSSRTIRIRRRPSSTRTVPSATKPWRR